MSIILFIYICLFYYLFIYIYICLLFILLIIDFLINLFVFYLLFYLYIKWWTHNIHVLTFASVSILFLWENVQVVQQHESLDNSSAYSLRNGNVLLNNTLNTFYLLLYGVGHMVKDHSDSKRGNLLPPHELLFPISNKDSFICIIPQTG